jgi:hypothetical protein
VGRVVEEPVVGVDGDLAHARVGVGKGVVGGGDDLSGIAVGGDVDEGVDKAVSGGLVDGSQVSER